MKRNITTIKAGGGDAVKNPETMRLLPDVLKNEMHPGINFLVTSAHGGVTNMLESILFSFYEKDMQAVYSKIDDLQNLHLAYAGELMPYNTSIAKEIEDKCVHLKEFFQTLQYANLAVDQIYSHVVSTGELLSGPIVHAYLKQEKIHCSYIDATNIIKTIGHKEAVLNFLETRANLNAFIESMSDVDNILVVTNGFVGKTGTSISTLGREGSDVSASIFAVLPKANQLTYLKKFAYHDKDPLKFNDAQFLPSITFSVLKKEIEEKKDKAILHKKTLSILEDFQGNIEIVEYTNTLKRTRVVR